LPGRRARRRLSHLPSCHAGGTVDAQTSEAQRGGPERYRGANKGGRRLQGVPVRPATEVAAAGTTAPPTVPATVSPGAVVRAAERLAPEDLAAAAAASTAKVFLLRLPSGRPRFRDVGGVAAGPSAPCWLPSGRSRPARRQPRLRYSPRVLPLRSERELWRRRFWLGREAEATGEGMEALGSEENPRELQDLRAGRARKAEPV
jgi:hypothetical protein